METNEIESGPEKRRALHLEDENVVHFTEEEWKKAQAYAKERGYDSVRESAMAAVRKDSRQARLASTLSIMRSELEELVELLKARESEGDDEE